MTKGKPWSVDEERKLRELVKSGVSIQGITKVMGKTSDSVQKKVRRLCLKEEGTVNFVVPSSSSSSSAPSALAGSGLAVAEASPQVPSLVSPVELPTVEEVLIKLAGVLANLEKPGLSRAETARCKAFIAAAEKYEKLYVDYAKYKAIEDRVVELEGKLFEQRKK